MFHLMHAIAYFNTLSFVEAQGIFVIYFYIKSCTDLHIFQNRNLGQNHFGSNVSYLELCYYILACIYKAYNNQKVFSFIDKPDGYLDRVLSLLLIPTTICMFNHSDPNSPHVFSKVASRGNSTIYMWRLLKCLTETKTLSTATLEGKEYMKLEKTGNNIKRNNLSCTYIVTLLLKQFPRATKVDISLFSLQPVALAIL